MSRVDAGLREQIEAWVGEGRIGDVFDALARFTDLRHSEQPPLSRQALGKVEGRPAAVHELVLGLACSNPSVGGFARKHVRRLSGDRTKGPLLELAVACLEPFRAADGANPLRKEIEEAGLSTDVPSGEEYQHSPASRYIKDVADTVVPILAGADLTSLAALSEFAGVYGRAPIDHEPEGEVSEPNGSQWVYLRSGEELSRALRKDTGALQDVYRGWAQRRLLLDQPAEHHLVPLARRFANRSDGDREVARRRRCFAAADALHAFAPPLRGELFRLYRDTVNGLPDARRHSWYQVCLDRFASRFPNEVDDPAESAAGEAADDGAGVDCEEALTQIAIFAHGLGLHDVFADAKEAAGAELPWLDGEGGPVTGYAGTPGDAAVLNAVIACFADAIASERDTVPARELAHADWAEPLDGLLQRAAEPLFRQLDAKIASSDLSELDDYDRWRGFYEDALRELERTFVLVLLLLPERSSTLWADRWRAHVEEPGLGRYYEGIVARRLADVEEQVGSVHGELMGAMMGSAKQSSGAWCAVAWKLYAGGGEAAVAAVRRSIARTSPPEPDPHSPRHACQPAYSAILWEAWRRGDLELLLSAIRSCALPYAGRGARACLPAVEDPRLPRNVAAVRPEGDGVPLTEVWARLRAERPNEAADALDAVLEYVDVEELPTTLLHVVARADDAPTLRQHRERVLSVCEASEPTAVNAALDVLERHPHLVGDAVDDVAAVLDRTLGLASGGPAKTAARLAATLSRELPHAAETFLELLLRAVWAEDRSFLETVLREAKRALAPNRKDTRPRPECMDAAVTARLQELSELEPKRFGKYASVLLELEA